MKKRIILLLVIVLGLFTITGCGNEKKQEEVIENNKTEEEIVENNKTEEELLWEDASKDIIYYKRITIYDSVEFEAIGASSGSIEGAKFSKDVDFLIRERNNNRFASKFLDLLDETNIQEIIDNGNDLEKYLLISYLCLRTNHHEGLGGSLNWVSNNMLLDENDELIKVYYRKQTYDKKGNFNVSDKTSLPYYIFEYSSPNETKNKYILSLGYYSNKFGSLYTDIDLYKYNSMKEVKKSSKIAYTKVDWVELKKDTIDKVITNNKEFLDFYIKYKNDIYYKRYDKEKNIYGESSGSYVKKDYSPSIGMTASEVEESTWGSPKKINKDTYSWGTTEQWVYDRGYIYFKNGKVTSISER